MSGLWIEYGRDGWANLTEEGRRNGATVVRAPSRTSGGLQFVKGYPSRITLHEIIGGASKSQAENHPTPPQVWQDVGAKILYQSLPLTEAGYALERTDSVVTNTVTDNMQVELSGYSTLVADESDEWLTNIAEMAVAPFAQYLDMIGNPIDLTQYPAKTSMDGSASPSWKYRYTADQHLKFNGVYGHAWVYGNSHWDPGAMDIGRVCEHARLIIAGKLPENTGDEMPGYFFTLQNGTIIASFASGTCRKATQPEVDFWRKKGVPEITEKFPQNWTDFFNANVVVTAPTPK